MKLIDELTKLVYDYSINKKFADEKFIMRTIDLCAHSFEVTDYVKNCEVRNIADQNVDAGYDVEKKTVVIDQSSLIHSGIAQIEEDKLNGYPSSEFMTYVKVNLAFVDAIVHELTHAKQYKKCLDNEQTLERELLELSMVKNLYKLRKQPITLDKKLYFQELDKNYRDKIYFEALPNERMANIRGLEFERSISKLLPEQKKENIEAYTELNLLNGKVAGYKDICPTTFIKYIDDFHRSRFGLRYGDPDISRIEEMYKNKAKGLTLDERLYLGLPVEETEIKKIKIKTEALRYSLKR